MARKKDTAEIDDRFEILYASLKSEANELQESIDTLRDLEKKAKEEYGKISEYARIVFTGDENTTPLDDKISQAAKTIEEAKKNVESWREVPPKIRTGMIATIQRKEHHDVQKKKSCPRI